MNAFYSTGPLPELHENCGPQLTCLAFDCGRRFCPRCEDSPGAPSFCPECYARRPA